MMVPSALTVSLRSPPPSCSRMMFPQARLPAWQGGRLANTSLTISFAERRGLSCQSFGSILSPTVIKPLFGCIRLLVNRIGGTEEYRLNSELALEQPLREIQFDFEVALRDVADIRMGEGVVPDFMAFLVNALGNAGILFNLQPDEEEGSFDVFCFQHVENLGGPCRVWAVIEGDCNFLL